MTSNLSDRCHQAAIMTDICVLLSAGGSNTLFIVFHCVTVCSPCCTQVFWRPDSGAAGSLFHVEKEATRRILPHWDLTANWLVRVSTHKESSSVLVQCWACRGHLMLTHDSLTVAAGQHLFTAAYLGVIQCCHCCCFIYMFYLYVFITLVIQYHFVEVV